MGGRCAGPCSLSRADQLAETVWNGPSEAGEVVERMESDDIRAALKYASHAVGAEEIRPLRVES